MRHAVAPFSFAIVIQQLPNPLRDAVCIFYLVLRALDTVEDDMALAVDIKLPALRVFYKSIYDRCPQQAGPWKGKQQQGQRSAWDTEADGLVVMQHGCRTFTIKCGYNHYKVLMEKFPLVVHVFLSLEPQVSVEGSQKTVH